MPRIESILRAAGGIASALSLLCALSMVAPAYPQTAADQVPESRSGAGKSKAAAESFEATLAVVRADPKLDFWFKTPSGTVPKLTTISRICPNEEFFALITMQHLGDVGRRRGHVTLDMSVVGADGTTQVLGTGLTAWDAPLPAKDNVSLATPVLSLRLDEKEALGLVRIIATLHDEGSGRSVTSEADLELAQWTYGEHPADEQAFSAWLATYHQSPKPSQAIRAYVGFAPVKEAERNDWNYATLAFFKTILLGNPWLVSHLVDLVPRCSEEEQLKIIVLLHLTGHDDLIETLPFEDPAAGRALVQNLASLTLPDPYGPLTDPMQLDQLWGEFFATGRYAPVRRIVDALTLGPLESPFTKERPPKTDAEKDRGWRSVISQVARWSLDGNVKQHELVRNYAQYMLESESLGKVEKQVLTALLSKAEPDDEGAAGR